MMQGPNPILEKEYLADGAVSGNRIVKAGTNDDDVAQGTAATEDFIGVSQHAAADNERVRIMEEGITEVEFGGTAAYNDPLTSDANGKAVKANPAAGTNNGIIGWSRCSAVSGDIGTAILKQGRIQG
jgi:hypothetical protein